jgi:hypothetical protein
MKHHRPPSTVTSAQKRGEAGGEWFHARLYRIKNGKHMVFMQREVIIQVTIH